MTNHSHNTWEGAGDFGPCWKNPHLAAIKVGGKDYSNEPPGRMVLRLIYLILLGLPKRYIRSRLHNEPQRLLQWMHGHS
jgi:hypothetical protein